MRLPPGLNGPQCPLYWSRWAMGRRTVAHHAWRAVCGARSTFVCYNYCTSATLVYRQLTPQHFCRVIIGGIRCCPLTLWQGASITTALGISWRHNPTVFSYKEYEDHGSVLGSNATHTGLLRADLVRARRESPLFDTDRWAKDYVHLLQQSVATMTEPQ